MRTLKEVKQEIKDLQDRHVDLGFTGQTDQTKRDGKRISFLTKVQYCLEKNPSEDFLVRQRSEAEKRINIINRDYPEFLKNDPLAQLEINAGKNPRTKYNSLMDMKKYKDEIQFIAFILD